MSPRRAAPLTIEHVLLALLDGKPMHGYELYQELSALKGISRIWNIKQALLYAILDKLETRGFLSSQVVQQATYPARKYFHLTASGKESLQAWLKTPVRRARNIRQEFLAKLVIAHRYGKEPVLSLIAAQKQVCREWFDELQSEKPPRDPDHLDEWLVYTFRFTRIEAVIGWLDQVELEIDRLLERNAG